jgi:hypothetical protein
MLYPCLDRVCKANGGNWTTMYPRKKSVALISALLVSLTLAACGGGGGDSAGGTDPATTTTGTTPSGTTTATASGDAKLRFVNAAACTSNALTMVGNNTTLSSPIAYNKSTPVQTVTQGNLQLAAVDFAAKNVALAGGKQYVVSALSYLNGSSTANDFLVVETAPFAAVDDTFRAKLVNTSDAAVDVYLTTSLDALPAIASLTAGAARTVGSELVKSKGDYRVVVTAAGDQTKVLFDTASADLKTATGDDLVIVIPPFGTCAGANTIRVQVLNQKVAGSDTTLLKNVAHIANATSSQGGQPSFGYVLTLDGADLTTLNTSGTVQTVNKEITAGSHTFRVALGTASRTAEPVLNKGKQYNASAACFRFTVSFRTIYDCSSLDITEIGEYGN